MTGSANLSDTHPTFVAPMDLKDYYSILELPPGATVADIKRAYRKLAHIFHPDKNGNDPYAAARFAEIKEAYEVLINPAKKEYYLQQRWYNQSIGKKRTQRLVTPENVLKQVIELEKYVSRLDIFRMDKQGLANHILEMINDETIAQLHSFHEPEIKRQIIAMLIKAARPLLPEQTPAIVTQFTRLAEGDPVANRQIDDFILHQRKKKKTDRNMIIIVIVSTLFISLLIWMASR